MSEYWGYHLVLDCKNGRKLNEDSEDDIRVFINGTLSYDWYYSVTDNTVYFTVIPSAGDLVEIGYLYIPEPEDTGDTGQ